MQTNPRAALTLILFLGPLLGLGLLNLLLPKPDVSITEQRSLRAFPLLSVERVRTGSFFREFDEYFGDRFIWRDRFVQAARGLMVWRALPGNDEAQMVIAKGDSGFASVRSDRHEKADEPVATYDPSVALLVLPDRALEVYKFHPDRALRYARLLNRFQERLPNGMTVYSLIAPTPIEFYNVSRYRDLSSPQREAIQFVGRHLASGITPIDAYDRIREHTSEYLYFRTDHHWTALGAYYAYQAFMEQTGRAWVPLDQFQVEQAEGFLGTTYSRTLNKGLEKLPDTVYVYRPPVEAAYQIHFPQDPMIELDMFNMNWAVGSHKYGIFLSGDVPLGKIITEVKNGRRIAVIKDSYANAFIPYLASHFEEIYVLDPRAFYLPVYDFLAEQGVQEVLFLNYMMATGIEDYLNLLERMIGE